MIPNQILNSCPITLFCSVVLYINTRAKNKDEQAEAMVDGNRIVKINSGESHNIQSLLSSADRDFLVRNNGDQVGFTYIFISSNVFSFRMIGF